MEESGFVHINTDPDPGGPQKLTDPDPKHWFLVIITVSGLDPGPQY